MSAALSVVATPIPSPPPLQPVEGRGQSHAFLPAGAAHTSTMHRFRPNLISSTLANPAPHQPA